MKPYRVRYQIKGSHAIKDIPRIYAEDIEEATDRAREMLNQQYISGVSIIGVYDLETIKEGLR